MAIATRLPAMIDALEAEIIENRAPPTMTMPPTGPRKSLAAEPMAASPYSVSPAARITITTRV